MDWSKVIEEPLVPIIAGMLFVVVVVMVINKLKKVIRIRFKKNEPKESVAVSVPLSPVMTKQNIMPLPSGESLDISAPINNNAITGILRRADALHKELVMTKERMIVQLKDIQKAKEELYAMYELVKASYKDLEEKEKILLGTVNSIDSQKIIGEE